MFDTVEAVEAPCGKVALKVDEVAVGFVKSFVLNNDATVTIHTHDEVKDQRLAIIAPAAEPALEDMLAGRIGAETVLAYSALGSLN